MPPAADYVLHLGRHIADLIHQYGSASHAIIWGVLFAETGFVITPFLPGDSMLFTAGLFARPEKQALNIYFLLFALPFACMMGDIVNFHLGKFFGHLLFRNDDAKVFKKSHLDKTRAFFDKHGKKTILICRFVPVIRALAPFAAGMDGMSRKQFIPLSILSAFLWVFTCVGSGYIFGGIPFVAEHFEEIILGIVVLSLLVILVEVVRDRVAHSKKQAGSQSG